MSFHDPLVDRFASHPGWGCFMARPEPLPADGDPIALVGVDVPLTDLKRSETTDNRIWNDIARRINAYPFRTSDQCSEKHYRDVFEFLRLNNGVVRRVVECGVFHGGLSVELAGCAVAFDLAIDLVDVNPGALLAAWHRIARTFPEALDRVRLFLGELPNYVQAVAADPDFDAALVHHDGSHRFPVVMRDLASLYYVHKRVHALIIQDTHLRHSDPSNFCFVDAAVAAVFGIDPRYQPVGTTFVTTTTPAGYRRGEKHNVYFQAGRPEGMLIPIAENRFLYPHPLIHRLDDFVQCPARQREAA
ncbi:hypothetical protein PQJ75_24285 [Rhodoplanes sp. TEM]|uniref:Class I SAM-dependent methyltransferase n=1 Tax=Rhodoplanes tepidamans TaxID=200616 RepID=A0ABT5JFW9_RHOTP|nr:MULTISPECIES: class I SAM-dependent methyltransferase [Rhodoplanes]MDC7788604.1 hypothetical protein [Rhodoplanes tepidamans]MDC7986860.1 hypothetical protein [Rhodoplanes sp. TEM]MDQ0358587.1 hypothetical protein [Rhodoplanes tepidamans]